MKNNLEENKKKSFLKSKMFLFAILPLFVIGLVVAGGYLVSTLTLTVGVAEPFTVQYGIVGDAEHYVDGQTCASVKQWLDSGTYPLGTIFAGDRRLFCVKIVNAGETAIYFKGTSSATNVTGADNTLCNSLFGGVIIDGNAVGLGTTTASYLLRIPDDTPTFDGCEVEVEVLRG